MGFFPDGLKVTVEYNPLAKKRDASLLIILKKKLQEIDLFVSELSALAYKCKRY